MNHEPRHISKPPINTYTNTNDSSILLVWEKGWGWDGGGVRVGGGGGGVGVLQLLACNTAIGKQMLKDFWAKIIIIIAMNSNECLWWNVLLFSQQNRLPHLTLSLSTNLQHVDLLYVAVNYILALWIFMSLSQVSCMYLCHVCMYVCMYSNTKNYPFTAPLRNPVQMLHSIIQ